MKIAVIGWGSLVWRPATLRLKSRWMSDGPFLPIEFARISRDGRLTLVIHPGSPNLRTYWAVSAFEAIEDARENLREREGASSLLAIHFVHSTNNHKEVTDGAASMISWLNEHPAMEAAVWTGLDSNWEALRGIRFTVDDAIEYLLERRAQASCGLDSYARAAEYIRNAPAQIQTELRKVLQQQAEFKATPLPEELFEQTPQHEGGE